MSSDKRRVQFRASEKLVGRADPLATVLGTDRTDVLTDALREYLRDAAHDDRLTRKTTTESFRTVEMLVGPSEAASVRVLKHHLDDLVLRLSAHARDAARTVLILVEKEELSDGKNSSELGDRKWARPVFGS